MQLIKLCYHPQTGTSANREENDQWDQDSVSKHTSEVDESPDTQQYVPLYMASYDNQLGGRTRVPDNVQSMLHKSLAKDIRTSTLDYQ